MLSHVFTILHYPAHALAPALASAPAPLLSLPLPLPSTLPLPGSYLSQRASA